jgi:hypothetical protein
MNMGEMILVTNGCDAGGWASLKGLHQRDLWPRSLDC